MPKALTPADRERWHGYLHHIKSGAELKPLTEEVIKLHIEASTGKLLHPTKNTTIIGLKKQGVVIGLQSGKRTVPFWEIIAAERVLRHWLTQDQAPSTSTNGDFRCPQEEIGVYSISHCYYAPTLAEYIRRSDIQAKTIEPSKV